MKGLLLKEFYILKKTVWFYPLLALFIAIVGHFTSTELSSFSFLFLFLDQSMFQLDRECGWADFQNTLPCTPLERVSARYISLIICSIPFIVASVLSNLTIETGFDGIAAMTGMEFASDLFLATGVILLVIAIDLPLRYAFKGSDRILQFVIFIIIIIFIILPYAVIAILTEFSFENPLTLIISVVLSLLVLGISFVMSVSNEANDGNYKKRFRNIAKILTVVAVLLFVLQIVFSVSEKRKNDNGKYSSSTEISDIQKDFSDFYSLFCNEFHLNMTVEECAEKLTAMGYYQNQTNPEKFYSESGKINLNLTTAENSDKIFSIYAYCNLTAEKRLNAATSETFEEIGSNFYEGMTQYQLQAKFAEIEAFPFSISETLIYDNQPRRVYVLCFACDDYEGVFDRPVTFRITAVTDGNTVVEVDRQFLKLFDDEEESVTSAETTEEPPLEKAKREITQLMNGFGNEYYLDKTPRECIKKLKELGYTESDEQSDLFYSEGGKVSVSLITDENDNLTEISTVVSYGEVQPFEDEEKLSRSFVTGMTESQFRNKLFELDLFPDTITEKFGVNNSFTRTYMIRCLIGEFDYNNPQFVSVSVDITDGKVTYVSIG